MTQLTRYISYNLNLLHRISGTLFPNSHLQDKEATSTKQRTMATTSPQFTIRNTETLLDIATDVVRLLRTAGETIGVAESLTAGGVMAALTSVPGASAAFRGGVVSPQSPLFPLLASLSRSLSRVVPFSCANFLNSATSSRNILRRGILLTPRVGEVSYATPLKQLLLSVDADLIAREGVIHADVASQMAEGARKATTYDAGSPTTWGVGTTGVAGPDPQDGKAVGTVFIGVASPEGARAWGPFSFPGSRERVREATVVEALSRLRDVLVARGGGGSGETVLGKGEVKGG